MSGLYIHMQSFPRKKSLTYLSRRFLQMLLTHLALLEILCSRVCVCVIGNRNIPPKMLTDTRPRLCPDNTIKENSPSQA
jgi:hypothetical protein